MAPVASSPYPVLGPLPPSLATKDRAASRKRFEDVYSIVRDDLLDDFRKHNMPEEVMAYYRRVCALLVLFLFLSDSNHLTEHGLQRTWWKAQSRNERRRLGRYP
jgi:hypothetical protein